MGAQPVDVHADQFAHFLGNDGAPAVPPDTRAIARYTTLASACWQALPITLPKLKSWLGAGRRLQDEFAELGDYALAIQALADVQVSLGLRFAQELDRQRVPYVLLKGMASRATIYPRPNSRGSMDVDLGVPRSHLIRAAAIARQLGFMAASLDDDRRHFHVVDPELRALVEAEHYELVCHVRRQVIRGLAPATERAIRSSLDRMPAWHETPQGELACYVTLDIHHGLCLDVQVDDVVASRQAAECRGQPVWVPDVVWATFHLIFKIYWEGVHNYRKGAYQFADLVRLSAHLQGREVSRLADLLEQYGLEAAGFYVLRRLEPAFGATVSPALRVLVDRLAVPPADRFPEEVNDLGDMWPKIWGIR